MAPSPSAPPPTAPTASKPDAFFRPDLSLSLRDRVLALATSISSDPAYTGFDAAPMRHTSLLSAAPGRTRFRLSVDPSLCNKSGILHGGAAATLLDNLTSTVLLTVAEPGKLDAGHVSRTIMMSYLRAVPAGAVCEVECWVNAVGRRLVNVEGVIRLGERGEGGDAIRCVHDKAVLEKGKWSAARVKL